MPPPDPRRSRWRSFRDVDAADPASLGTYLDELAALPMVAQEKLRSLDLLHLAAGARCLDVGCGAGPELGWLAQLVGPAGSVVALDRSRHLLQAAAARHRQAVITFVQGDAASLPFDSDAFDAARADRTLQHVADPGRALRELVRVTRPGGRVALSEFRWGLVAPDLDRAVTERVLALLAPEPDRREWVGHALPALAAEAGVRNIETATHTYDVEDLIHIARLLNLRWSIDAAVERLHITAAQAEGWRRSLDALVSRGDAFAVIVFLHVAGDA